MSKNHFQDSKILLKSNFSKNYSYGLSEFWDKPELNLFLTISKTKDSKNVALFE